MSGDPSKLDISGQFSRPPPTVGFTDSQAGRQEAGHRYGSVHPWRCSANTYRALLWYPKPAPTFADALARLRQHLWLEQAFALSPENTDMRKTASPLLRRLIESVCYAPLDRDNPALRLA